MGCKTCGSVRSAFTEAREAFENIPMDLVSGVTLKQSLGKRHRLRGLGLILVLIGLMWFTVTLLNSKIGKCSN